MDEIRPVEGNVWIEWQGKALSDPVHCQDEIAVAKQKIYDELYEDFQYVELPIGLPFASLRLYSKPP